MNNAQSLLSLDPSSKRIPKKAVLKTQESIYLIEIDDIVRCEANGNYTQFFLKDTRKIIVSKTMKEYEHLLNEQTNFYRVHNSHLINLNYMERFDKKEGGMIVMKDKTIIPVAARKKGELLVMLESI